MSNANQNNNNNNNNVQIISNNNNNITMSGSGEQIIQQQQQISPNIHINALTPTTPTTVEVRPIVQQSMHQPTQQQQQHQQHEKPTFTNEAQQMTMEQIIPLQQQQQQHDIINTNQQIYHVPQAVRDNSTLKTYLLPAKTTVTAANAATTIAAATASPVEESFEPNVAGTQKTAEKMRRDEALGEMATISAVLYANTQHPELKEQYPNWSDRCKQILKRWRSLSTEKKAPFLQHAKDNRSSLRMRRAQQDQEKICFQQKSLKEQEQERIWKQHQAKAKEANCGTAYISEGKTIGLPVETGGKPQQQQQQQQQPQQQSPQLFSNITPNVQLQTSSGFKSNFMQNLIAHNKGPPALEIKCDANNSRIIQLSTQQQQQQQSSSQNIINNNNNNNNNNSNSNQSNNADNVNDNNQMVQKQQYTEQWLTNEGKISLQQHLQQHGTSQHIVPGSIAAASRFFQQLDDSNNKMNVMLEVHKLPDRMQQQQQILTTSSGIGGDDITGTTITIKNVNISQATNDNNSTVNTINVLRQHQQQQSDIQQSSSQHHVVTDNNVVPSVGGVELERLDHYENTGLGDILGGLGEGDDDELFQSLTSEIGEDFNILEYADPELDALTNNQNLLNKLDFDDNDKNT